MAINYKNVVSVQTGATASASGYTYATAGGTPANIIKHKGFVLVPAPGAQGATLAGAIMSLFPTYFGADGLTLTGVTLTTGGVGGPPVEVPLRMKTFTGLTGGSILFVV